MLSVVVLALVLTLLVLIALTFVHIVTRTNFATARDHLRHMCFVCHACKGSGRVYLPGAVMKCAYCAKARAFLAAFDKEWFT